MKRLVGLLIVLVVATIAPATALPTEVAAQTDEPTCAMPFTATDGTGTEVTIEAAPERVVALQPSAAQTMWEIGSQEKVVGMPVGSTTSYLEGSDSKTDITGSDGYSTSVEKVVAQEPDLVLAPSAVPNETVSKLRSAGLTVYKFGFAASIDDVVSKTLRTGQLVGNCSGAADRVDAMNETVESIETAVSDTEQPRVLFMMSGGYTPGKGTFIHQLITTAGGTNVAADANITGYQQINPETVVAEDPEWIVTQSHMESVPNGTELSATTAMKEEQIVTVDSNFVSQPAPRVVQPLSTMANAFHPDAVESSTGTESGADSQTPATETTETNGPGFGVVATVLAVLALLGGLFTRAN
ncbi:PGF-CTERM-anchored ABC transporter substrate-binding protein [Halocatena halophila]|uniref:PGF-CTERM-anchored ABC transporter substrate-binding protein n=1 Tax=Halocatena halophila TaxID=2814576 RepID=UPI002ED56FA0